jgi:hypothetical protein
VKRVKTMGTGGGGAGSTGAKLLLFGGGGECGACDDEFGVAEQERGAARLKPGRGAPTTVGLSEHDEIS